MRRNPSRVVGIRVPLEFRTTGVTSLGGPSSTAIPRTGPALSQSPMAFHRHRLRVRLMLTLPSTRATVVRTPPGDTASIGTSPACRTPSPKAGSKSSTVPHRLLIPCGTEVAQAILLLRRGIHQAINAVVLTASRGGRTEWRALGLGTAISSELRSLGLLSRPEPLQLPSQSWEQRRHLLIPQIRRRHYGRKRRATLGDSPAGTWD